jgi:hypothetical protein
VKPKNPKMGHLAAIVRDSQKAREFLKTMTDSEWDAWQPRYHALIDMSQGKPGFLPEMTWWENDFLTEMLSHPGMMEQLKIN